METETKPEPEMPEAEHETAQSEKPEVSKLPKEHKHPKKFLVSLVVLVVILFGAGTYFVLNRHKSTTASNQTNSTVTTVQPAPKTPTQLEQQIAKFTTPTTGEKWYSTPKNLPLQGFLNTKDVTEETATTQYFEVGTHGSNTIIMSSFTDGPGEDNELFEKAPDGKVSLILHPDANSTYIFYTGDTNSDKYDAQESAAVATSVKIDKTTHYDSLSLPLQLDLGGGEYATPPLFTGLGELPNHSAGSSLSNPTTLIKKYGDSVFNKVEHPYTDTGLTTIYYSVSTPIDTTINTSYSPIGSDLSAIAWQDGNKIKDTFGGIVRGCGSVRTSVSRDDNVSDSDFVKAGTAADGKIIYQFKSNSNVTLQKAWQETKEYYNGGSDADSIAKANISLEDFVKNKAVFAYKSPNNGWLIFTRDTYAPIGGCAKPVVYLYPTQPEEVSVKVGATVKISDPLYNPATGWHAFAWPNGQLIVNGKTYSSLFWEGPGNGVYPGITSGAVVKRADAAATIRKQLTQQGLTSAEANDFMAYWTDKIPANPYIRLSWFNTAEMNELAPLYISPKPTTLLRAFLDMDGLNQPISMPAQTFSAPKRVGFTAVEWGGLAQGKLY